MEPRVCFLFLEKTHIVKSNVKKKEQLNPEFFRVIFTTPGLGIVAMTSIPLSSFL